MLNRTTKPVLGVMRGADALYAVLLEQTEEELVVRFSLSPTLIPEEEPNTTSSSTDDFLGLDGETSDVTLHFEDEELAETDPWSEEANSRSSSTSKNVRSALDALLTKCAHRGYENPHIAFCDTHSETDQVEVQVPAEEARGEAEDAFLPAPRTVLLELLKGQYQVEEERVGFLPMSPGSNGTSRALALLSRPTGAVATAIASMPTASVFQSSPVQRLETEVSVYFGWARSILGASPGRSETSLVVRVGTEDTLLLFLEDGALKRVDTLPSLTIDDPPDTICSRVLLYQDEYGMGDVQNILLMSEGDENEMVEGFEPYFSKTDIRLLRDQLPYQADDSHRGLYSAAIGAAVRVLEETGDTFDVPAMNLMGREHARAFWSPSMGRRTAALFLALFLSTSLGFAWYGMHNAREIRQSRSELHTLERKIERVDRDALQRRADSLQSILDRQSRSRDVTEDLLRGSNKWSRALADVAIQVRTVGEIAIRNWTPQTSTEVEITGHAAARPSIIEFAQELGGEIRSVTFTEIRGRSLYAFSISVPMDTTAPAAVSYWESKQATLAAEEDTTDEDSMSSPSSPMETSSTGPDTETRLLPAPATRLRHAASAPPLGSAVQPARVAASAVRRLRHGPLRGSVLFSQDGRGRHA